MTEQWSNRSVRRLAGKGDAVDVITRAAQDLVVRAIDAGWTGPPFDPFALAAFLRIPLVARDDVVDARTVPAGATALRIEFNPNRPASRVRFSLAHELAHTLFPDCAEDIRNRGRHQASRPDEWQLEALCNLAAAEFLMPLGSLPELSLQTLTMEDILKMRADYAVSTEAILLRLVRLADEACAMFSASHTGARMTPNRYQVDYIVPSADWRLASYRANLLPVTSIVAECTAIGFTAHGVEVWPGGQAVRVHAVGVPAYPGYALPRVVGLLAPVTARPGRTPLITYVRGDATQPRGQGPRIIAHVVNDKTPNWGGGGFASSLRRRWSVSQDEFRAAVVKDSKLLTLGRLHTFMLNEDVIVASLVAQHGYGPSTKPRIRYSALRLALQRLAEFAVQYGAAVHMPRIGVGQAGGSWDVVRELIRQTLGQAGIAVTVYDLPGATTKEQLQRALVLES